MSPRLSDLGMPCCCCHLLLALASLAQLTGQVALHLGGFGAGDGLLVHAVRDELAQLWRPVLGMRPPVTTSR